jgi:hypothetical protein
MAEVVQNVFADAVDAGADDASLVEFDVGNLYAFDPTPIDPQVS